MIRIEKTVEVKRPPEDVFAYVCDPANASRWNTWVLDATQLTPGSVQVGTKVRTKGRFLGVTFENEWEYTSWDAPRSFSVKSISGPLSMQYRYEFLPIGDGTRIVASVDGNPGTLFKVAEPLMAGMARRQFEADHNNLKDLLESAAVEA